MIMLIGLVLLFGSFVVDQACHDAWIKDKLSDEKYKQWHKHCAYTGITGLALCLVSLGILCVKHLP